jgi:hypothetical protein
LALPTLRALSDFIFISKPPAPRSPQNSEAQVSRQEIVWSASRADLHDEEDVDQLECRRRHNEEIASDDGFGVIAHEGY